MPLKLWPHQRIGADWLKARNRAYLGDRPRVGKTLTLATAAAELGGTVLVLCPAIVRTHWRETLAGAGCRHFEVMSYDQFVRSFDGGFDPHILILDEAHFLKNMEAKRTRMILGPNGIVRDTRTVWAASGTPIPRHPGEWYAIGSTLFPRVLAEAGIRTYSAFEQQFIQQRNYWAHGRLMSKVVGMKNEEKFRAILDRVMLRRTLDDIGLDQPPLLWQVLAVDGDTIEWTPLGAQVGGDFYSYATTLRHEVGKAKAAAVGQLIREQLEESDEKIVVFAHHLDVLDTIEQELATKRPQIGYAYIDGSVPQEERDAQIAAFRLDPTIRVFLGQNIACQTGIDLSSASSVLLVEPDWTATVNDQLGHRILGPNQQSKHVVAQMISLAGTIDDSILRQNAREADMLNRMFGKHS